MNAERSPGLFSSEAGDPSSEPMLFLHGFLSSNLQWDLNRSELSQRLRMIEVELMGHGSSPAPDDPAAYQPMNQIALLEHIRTGLGIDRWWVCGQSMGGAVAVRYVLTHPERTRGLIFTNSRAAFGVPRPLDELRGGAAQAQAGAQVPAAADEDPATERDPGPDAGPALRPRDLPFHPIAAKRFPADLKARMVKVADSVPPHVVSHTLACRRNWRTSDELHQLTVPVLLVNGRWEKRFQPSLAVARSSIADLTVVNLEGGHSINVEQPEGFNTAVINFVESHRG